MDSSVSKDALTSGSRGAATSGHRARFWIGVALLAIATIASLLLVFEHFGALSLPGCGRGSPCARAAASVWGTVPLLHWPTAFAGFAYFVAALVVWLFARGRLTGWMRWIVRAAAVVSFGFILLIFFKDYLCNYCLATHVANLGFAVVALGTWRRELSASPDEAAKSGGSLRPSSTSGPSLSSREAFRHALLFGGVFLVVSAVLGLLVTQESGRVAERQESERVKSTAEIIAALPPSDASAGAQGLAGGEDASGRDAGAAASGPEADASGPDAGAGSPANAGGASATASPTGREETPASPSSSVSSGAERPIAPWTGPFTGRYRRGPEKAAVRIVIYTDYQCRDCVRIEKDIDQLLARHPNVSLSVKQFPMCTDCNPRAERNLHPNACWAARVAETAGLLKGADGFFRMHDWLFSVSGSFTHEVLQAKLKELGYDPAAFISMMRSDRPLELVRGDIDEGLWLGLHYTPMVFVNGVEMKGIFAPNAIIRTVEEVLAHQPPARDASGDQPPPALTKYVDDWRQQPVVTIPPDASPWTLGPANAAVEVIIWGDYQEPNSATADSLARAMVAKRPNVRYTFHHFPVHTGCNPVSQRDLHPQACFAAQAAEAAGRLGGQQAFWRMHAWLFAHPGGVTQPAVEAQAAAMGLDRAAFARTLADAAVSAAIREDCLAGKQLGLISVPSVYVNRQFVPRWRLEGADPFGLILDAASK